MPDSGIIEHSVSLWASAIVLVKKPDQTMRIRID